MVAIENVIINAEVKDNFSRQFDDLKQQLGQIEALGESADVEIDGHIGTIMAELHAVEAKIRQVDKMDANPDVHVDGGLTDPQTMWNLFDLHNDPGPHWKSGRGNPFGRNIQFDAGIDMPDLSSVAGRRRERGVGGRARNIRKAWGQFRDMRVTMGMLMNLFAGLIPLIAIFVATLPAAIAGLVALAGAALAAAGALGGVIGLALGGLAFQDGEFAPDRLMEQMSELADVFIESFGPLMNALEPLANEIFRHAEFFIRDLATRMSVLLDMTDMAGGAVGWLAQTLPVVLQEMAMFGEAAAPIMQFIIGGISEIDWFGIFADVVTRVIGPMTMFMGILMRMAPIIFEASVRFMHLANVILGLVGGIFTLIDILPGGAQLFATLLGIVLLLISATAIYTLATGTLAANFAMLAKTIYSNTLGALYSYIATQYSAAAATLATAAAVMALWSALTFGLAPVLSGFLGGIAGFGGNNVQGINKQLNQFETQRARTGQSGAWSQDRNTGYTEINSTIVAPDKETGLATANSNHFLQRSRTVDPTDVENEQHSG